MKQLKFSAGFTLTELLVVIAIVGILASIVVPSFQSMIRNERIKNASFEMYSSLLVARSAAIKRNANVTITPTSSSWQAGWTIESDDGVIRNQSALNGIVVTNAPAMLTFKRTGRLSGAASAAYQFDVDPADAAYTRCITIELSGLPRTTRGACS